MLQVHALTLGAYQVNCYIIHDEKSTSCCVIDPGYEADTILDKLSELGLTLEAILLTHGHFDHVGAVRDIAADTDCQVYLCADDLCLPTNLTAGKLYYTQTYAEGTRLHLAGLDITVLQTPGHTPGSVCLLIGDSLFSGDTLFAGSCGRTDLPGGSWTDMQNSLKRMSQIEANLWVLPGHGESTMLASEKKYNPYLR
ncbi:MAG: MBL fold metallo-hydrolase [Clostridiales bacterium]|nr:MBL fold metallo-hydrolase [Clostridiales bacterium]